MPARFVGSSRAAAGYCTTNCPACRLLSRGRASNEMPIGSALVRSVTYSSSTTLPRFGRLGQVRPGSPAPGSRDLTWLLYLVTFASAGRRRVRKTIAKSSRRGRQATFRQQPVSQAFHGSPLGESLLPRSHTPSGGSFQLALDGVLRARSTRSDARPASSRSTGPASSRSTGPASSRSTAPASSRSTGPASSRSTALAGTRSAPSANRGGDAGWEMRSGRGRMEQSRSRLCLRFLVPRVPAPAALRTRALD